MYRSLSPGAIGVAAPDLEANIGYNGYNGPLMVEPFSETVRKMGDEDACAATAAALQQVWDATGL